MQGLRWRSRCACVLLMLNLLSLSSLSSITPQPDCSHTQLHGSVAGSWIPSVFRLEACEGPTTAATPNSLHTLSRSQHSDTSGTSFLCGSSPFCGTHPRLTLRGGFRTKFGEAHMPGLTRKRPKVSATQQREKDADTLEDLFAHRRNAAEEAAYAEQMEEYAEAQAKEQAEEEMRRGMEEAKEAEGEEEEEVSEHDGLIVKSTRKRRQEDDLLLRDDGLEMEEAEEAMAEGEGGRRRQRKRARVEGEGGGAAEGESKRETKEERREKEEERRRAAAEEMRALYEAG